MRKYILLLLLIGLCPNVLRAQLKVDRGIKSGLFVPKGAWLGGATFSYTENEQDGYKFLVLDDINANGYTFKISPFVGYFIKDNIAVGLRATYGRTYVNLGNIDINLGDDLSFQIENYRYLSHKVSASGFARTYMALGGSKIFGFFNEMRLTYGYGQGKVTSGTGTSMTGTWQKVNNLQIGCAPGLTAFVSNFASVEVSIGIVGLDFSWTDQITNQVEHSHRRKSSGDFKIDLFSLNIGLTLYL